MRFATRQYLRVLKRAETFCTKQPPPAPFAALPPGFADQVATLQNVLMKLAQVSADQQAGRRSLGQFTAVRRQRRAALRDQHLKPLHKVARSLERTHPGLSIKFRLPPYVLGEAALINLAKAALQDLQPFHDLLSAALGPDFITRMEQAIADLELAEHEANDSRDQAVGGTAEVSAVTTEAREALRIVGAMIEAVCAGDVPSGKVTLRRWRSATRIGRLWARTLASPASPPPSAPSVNTNPTNIEESVNA